SVPVPPIGLAVPWVWYTQKSPRLQTGLESPARAGMDAAMTASDRNPTTPATRKRDRTRIPPTKGHGGPDPKGLSDIGLPPPRHGDPEVRPSALLHQYARTGPLTGGWSRGIRICDEQSLREAIRAARVRSAVAAAEPSRVVAQPWAACVDGRRRLRPPR